MTKALTPDQAWEKAMAPARLPSTNPKRVSYPEAARRALAAWKAARGEMPDQI